MNLIIRNTSSLPSIPCLLSLHYRLLDFTPRHVRALSSSPPKATQYLSVLHPHPCRRIIVSAGEKTTSILGTWRGILGNSRPLYSTRATRKGCESRFAGCNGDRLAAGCGSSRKHKTLNVCLGCCWRHCCCCSFSTISNASPYLPHSRILICVRDVLSPDLVVMVGDRLQCSIE